MSNTAADEIQKLADLKERGALTEKEFEAQKMRLLSGKPLRKKWPLWVRMLMLLTAGFFFISGMDKILMPQFIMPPDNFLRSELLVRPGIANETGTSVREFAALLESYQLDNGEALNLEGWSKSDNLYTLHLLIKREHVELKFLHDLSGDHSGRYSLLMPVDISGEVVSPLVFFHSIIAGPFISRGVSR